MKKRVLAGVLVTVLALSIGTTSAFAAGPDAGQGRNFVDEDGNGICDFAVDSCRYVDENNDGVCDYYGTGGYGCKFADEDGDGVCDFYGVRHDGYGRNFVDADDDGVCDNNRGYGLGMGRGFRGGRNG